jgi:hypothetical protein
MNNDIFARVPVDRRRNTVLIWGLEGVNYSEEFGRVAAGWGGVGEDEADRLLRVDDEDWADCKGDSSGVDIRCILVVKLRMLGYSFRVSRVERGGGGKEGKRGWGTMSYAKAILRSLSPMMGKVIVMPAISSISLIHPPWVSTVFAESPINFTPRFVNSGSYFARAASSVVHTGV